MADGATLNHTSLDKDTPSGKAGREKVAVDGEGKRDPLPADEFTKATFTAAQKVLREQRSRAPARSLSYRPCCPAARPCCPCCPSRTALLCGSRSGRDVNRALTARAGGAHRSLLAKFRQENVELRSKIAELSTAGFDEDQGTIGSLASVARLAEEAETYSAKIEVEKRRISEHERKLRDCDKEIKEKRDLLAQSATDGNMRKQVQKLNDSLDLAAKRFASQIAENKKARAEINELRRERKRFKQLMAQYKNRTLAAERQVSEVVADSQAYLEERAEYGARIEDLQHTSDTMQQEFLEQCRELKHVIRAFDMMEEKLSKGDESLPSVMGNMTAEQEEDLQKKVVKGKWQLAKEKAMTDLLKEQALNFEEAFEKLQAATGFAKIEDFVSHFIQIEELNFHRFQVHLESSLLELIALIFELIHIVLSHTCGSCM